MKIDETIRVLLLANEFNSARILLREHGDATGLDIREARSRQDFQAQLQRCIPDVVVAQSQGFDGLPLTDVLHSAANCSPGVPVIVLGEDGEDGQDAVRYLDEGAVDYIPFSHVERLTLVIQRVRADQKSILKQQTLQHDLQLAYNAMMANQKLMSIGRLAASIAHEINNPLESITNLLYLLRMESGLSQNAERYISLAEREMERVAQISKQTLNFYRETRTPVRVRPSDLLEEVLVLYSRRIEERRMDVVRQYRSDESVLVFPGEMRQVFSNLVTNAIEASPVGGKLLLRVHKARKWSDEGINGIRVVIADHGSGIDAATRQHLGQLFYTTKGQRGTGLGLWVTQAIVKRYGGEIQLYSSTRPGRHGTVFSIFMPTNMRPRAVVPETYPAELTGNLSIGKNQRIAREGLAVSDGEFSAEGRRSRSYRRNPGPLAAS